VFFAIFVVTVVFIAVAEHFLPAALLHIFKPSTLLIVLAFGPHEAAMALFAVIVEFTLLLGSVGPHELALPVPIVLLPLAFLEGPIWPFLTTETMFHIGFPLSILFSSICPFEETFAV